MLEIFVFEDDDVLKREFFDNESAAVAFALAEMEIRDELTREYDDADALQHVQWTGEERRRVDQRVAADRRKRQLSREPQQSLA